MLTILLLKHTHANLQQLEDNTEHFKYIVDTIYC